MENQNYLVHPAPNDVLCGSASRHTNHPGNQLFKSLIDLYAAQYCKAKTKKRKSHITQVILEKLDKAEARILKKHPIYNKWYVTSRKVARDKVGHAFRGILNRPRQEEHKDAAISPTASSPPKTYAQCKSPKTELSVTCHSHSHSQTHLSLAPVIECGSSHLSLAEQHVRHDDSQHLLPAALNLLPQVQPTSIDSSHFQQITELMWLTTGKNMPSVASMLPLIFGNASSTIEPSNFPQENAVQIQERSMDCFQQQSNVYYDADLGLSRPHPLSQQPVSTGQFDALATGNLAMDDLQTFADILSDEQRMTELDQLMEFDRIVDELVLTENSSC